MAIAVITHLLLKSFLSNQRRNYLNKKQENQVQLLRQKQKIDEAAKRLQNEIQLIKAEKVGEDLGFVTLIYIYTIKFGADLVVVVGSTTTQDKTIG